MAFISAKRRHTASGSLQDGSFGRVVRIGGSAGVARQSEEPCFACAEVETDQE